MNHQKKVNYNKTAHVNEKGMIVYYTDTKTFNQIPFEKDKISKMQVYGTHHNGVRYQDAAHHALYENQFNRYQNKLYKEVIHGLSAYQPDEVKQMSFREKLSIENRYIKAQLVLNEWKQTIINQQVDQFLQKLFPHSRMVKEMVNETFHYTDEQLTNQETFSDLGISKEQIIEKLIEVDVLPRNFYHLKPTNKSHAVQF